MTGWIFINNKATITAINEIPLREKHQAGPKAA
jgi:hypothetical protein